MTAALFDTAGDVQRSAVISDDGLYRYRLDRWWGPESVGTGTTRMPFMMCNPSDADADIDDPTVRRCMGFARREGCNGISVVNAGALRTPDPDIWCHSADPFGPDNSEYVISLAETAGYIVAAWGAHPAAVIAGEAYLKAFRELDIPVLCLGVTKAGHPRHPLYVRGDQPLISLREATNG